MPVRIPYALRRLERSRFRSRFHLDEKDKAYIQEKGMDVIRMHAYDFILTRLAPAEPANDGRQTPMRGHPVFKAQHATATCCRGCLGKWYGVPQGREMTAQEIDETVQLIMAWIEKEAQ